MAVLGQHQVVGACQQRVRIPAHYSIVHKEMAISWKDDLLSHLDAPAVALA